MKKVFLSFVVVSSIVISCQKTKVEPKQSYTSNLTANESSVKTNSARTRPSYRILLLSPDRTICVCVSKGGNCLPDVVVRPRSSADLLVDNIITAVNSGNPADVQQIFIDNQALLTTIMETSDIDQVISSVLTVSTARSSDGAVRFLILSNSSNNEIEIGYPFVY